MRLQPLFLCMSEEKSFWDSELVFVKNMFQVKEVEHCF